MWFSLYHTVEPLNSGHHMTGGWGGVCNADNGIIVDAIVDVLYRKGDLLTGGGHEHELKSV